MGGTKVWLCILGNCCKVKPETKLLDSVFRVFSVAVHWRMRALWWTPHRHEYFCYVKFCANMPAHFSCHKSQSRWIACFGLFVHSLIRQCSLELQIETMFVSHLECQIAHFSFQPFTLFIISYCKYLMSQINASWKDLNEIIKPCVFFELRDLATLRKEVHTAVWAEWKVFRDK